MRAADNKYLIVKSGVILTPIVEPVIVALDQWFQAAGLRAYVTRALTDAYGQLDTVQTYIKVRGLEKMYPEAMLCRNPMDMIGKFYAWQLAWSHLLNLKVIINPPLAAVCLMDYYGPDGKGTNRKGKLIIQTPHMNPVSTGKGCFDIGGKTGMDPTINDELVIVKNAEKKGIKGMIHVLPEHNNNAIHIDCIKG